MAASPTEYSPGDPRLVDKIITQLKSQGIFDQFRRECLDDVDTKPAYQNLHRRVEGAVNSFLGKQQWHPDLNKNQLRENLRKHIKDSGFLEIGVERIVDQVMNPRIMTVFVPHIEEVVYKFMGIEKPGRKYSNSSSDVPALSKSSSDSAFKKDKDSKAFDDLLPKDLDPVSPESDADMFACENDITVIQKEVEESDNATFTPIDTAEPNVTTPAPDDNSMDSRMSGVSATTNNDTRLELTVSAPENENSNNDSQFSKVSAGSGSSVSTSDDLTSRSIVQLQKLSIHRKYDEEKSYDHKMDILEGNSFKFGEIERLNQEFSNSSDTMEKVQVRHSREEPMQWSSHEYMNTSPVNAKQTADLGVKESENSVRKMLESDDSLPGNGFFDVSKTAAYEVHKQDDSAADKQNDIGTESIFSQEYKESLRTEDSSSRKPSKEDEKRGKNYDEKHRSKHDDKKSKYHKDEKREKSKHGDKDYGDAKKDRTKESSKHDEVRRDKTKSGDKSHKDRKDKDRKDRDRKDKDRKDRDRKESSIERKKEETVDQNRERKDSHKSHKDSSGSSRDKKDHSKDGKSSHSSQHQEKKDSKDSKDRKDGSRDHRDKKDSSRHSKDSSKYEKDKSKSDKKRDDDDSDKRKRSEHRSEKRSKDSKDKSVVDDHHMYRDKNSEDRRSTDRDSNGASSHGSRSSEQKQRQDNSSSKSGTSNSKSNSDTQSQYKGKQLASSDTDNSISSSITSEKELTARKGSVDNKPASVTKTKSLPGLESEKKQIPAPRLTECDMFNPQKAKKVFENRRTSLGSMNNNNVVKQETVKQNAGKTASAIVNSESVNAKSDPISLNETLDMSSKMDTECQKEESPSTTFKATKEESSKGVEDTLIKSVKEESLKGVKDSLKSIKGKPVRSVKEESRKNMTEKSKKSTMEDSVKKEMEKYKKNPMEDSVKNSMEKSDKRVMEKSDRKVMEKSDKRVMEKSDKRAVKKSDKNIIKECEKNMVEESMKNVTLESSKTANDESVENMREESFKSLETADVSKHVAKSNALSPSISVLETESTLVLTLKNSGDITLSPPRRRDTRENSSTPTTPISPSSSLPFKKRPVTPSSKDRTGVETVSPVSDESKLSLKKKSKLVNDEIEGKRCPKGRRKQNATETKSSRKITSEGEDDDDDDVLEYFEPNENNCYLSEKESQYLNFAYKYTGKSFITVKLSYMREDIFKTAREMGLEVIETTQRVVIRGARNSSDEQSDAGSPPKNSRLGRNKLPACTTVEKRESRRARKPNHKYSSDEYASIFNTKEDKNSSLDGSFEDENTTGKADRKSVESLKTPYVRSNSVDLKECHVSITKLNQQSPSVIPDECEVRNTKPVFVTNAVVNSHDNAIESVCEDDDDDDDEDVGLDERMALKPELILPSLQDLMIESGMITADKLASSSVSDAVKPRYTPACLRVGLPRPPRRKASIDDDCIVIDSSDSDASVTEVIYNSGSENGKNSEDFRDRSGNRNSEEWAPSHLRSDGGNILATQDKKKGRPRKRKLSSNNTSAAKKRR